MVEETTDVSSQDTRIDRRRVLSDQQKNKRKQHVAFALIGVFLLIMAGIILAGYVVIFVMPPRELVVRVDDVRYTRGDMVKLLRVRQKGSEFLGSQFNAGSDIFLALQLIVENELIALEAPKFGITVTEEEVDFDVERLIAPTFAQSGGKTEDQLDREFKEQYGAYLNAIQLSREEHRQIIRRAILREKFRQFIGDSVPSVAEQAHVYRIAIQADDELDIMTVKYKDFKGIEETPSSYQRAFFSITREFSRDNQEIVRRGGDLGWAPRGINSDYDYVIFDLEPGELSTPVSDVDNPNQMLMFMVSEKSDAREISPGHRNTLKTQALLDWINENRKGHEVYAVFNSDIYSWMIQQLGISSSVTPEPVPDDPLQRVLSGGGL